MRKPTTRRSEINAHPIWLVLAILLASAFFVLPSASAQQCDPVEMYKLLPDDGGYAHRFGCSVAISPDGIGAIIGAHGDGWGSAYLFDTATGTQIAKLLPADPAGGFRLVRRDRRHDGHCRSPLGWRPRP